MEIKRKSYFRLHNFKSKVSSKGKHWKDNNNDLWEHQMVKVRMHPDDEKILIRQA